jgi:hypothetical protein
MSRSLNRVVKLFCLTNQALTISHSWLGSSNSIYIWGEGFEAHVSRVSLLNNIHVLWNGENKA